MREIEIQVPRKRYICEHCGEEFTNKIKCRKHERLCLCNHEFGEVELDFYYAYLTCKLCNCSFEISFVKSRNADILKRYILNNLEIFEKDIT